MELKKITIYSDGSSLGNPGPGGYGVVIIYKDKRKELSAGFKHTTNNRMELMAAIEGLNALKEKCDVTLYTDSRYVVDGIMKGWAENWRRKGWMRNKIDKAVNVDLWQKLLDLIEKHKVEIKWVQGHAGHPENECCDVLAKNAAMKGGLPEDKGYNG
jgi:ribonuclease HI